MSLAATAGTPGKPTPRDLIAEANHRIANSLSAVASLVQHHVGELDSSAPITRAEVRHILGKVSARVDAIARLHRLLSQADPDSPVDIGGYLQQVTAGLVGSVSTPEAATFHFIGDIGCRVPSERALYLGLITVELVTNSLKYAHPTGVPGHISLRCRRDSEGIDVEVSDDGVGLPEGFDAPSAGTSGLQLIRSLATQLGGTLTFVSDSLGTSCTVRVPLQDTVSKDPKARSRLEG